MAATSMDSYLQVLYSTVDAKKTPLPTSWSCKDKDNFIKLSHMQLRAHYKGYSLSVKDTSCVRSDHPIPLACGLYYFEVKVIDKGIKGSIAIGIGTKKMNLSVLPGMQKNSFGYLGNSGGKFWGSEVGRAYGPPFTTNDTIGCGVNLVARQIFYTKNGKNLGEAFSGTLFDVSPVLALYPTVGLQSKGEVVEANFGQSRFLYNIKNDIKELKKKVASSIIDFPIKNEHSRLPAVFHSLVSSYLMHQGYYSTAESFARCTGQELDKELLSIKSRQRIQDLVSSGRMEEAINTTLACYPTLLDSHSNLFFLLKVHHFIELIGTLNNKSFSAVSLEAATASLFALQHEAENDVEMKETSSRDSHLDTVTDSAEDDYHEMEADGPGPSNAFASQGNISRTRRHVTDEGLNRRTVMRIIQLGRELLIQKSTLEKQYGVNETNNDILAKAFSLISHTNRPLEGPLSELFDTTQREVLGDAINSAILEANQLPKKSALHLIIGYVRELLLIMAQNGIGASAFANINQPF
ncbi:ran-binding protein 9 isoform X3 [Daphnia magna]|uniref:Ran-binding proteins 9/10 n=1 Tax=Daphnia magna TaxID=35525 RepID=A0ABQ9YVX4_9CRUS|nr:ran-binding protein 9 isoform X3 [Daphnia magna]KAK4004804.1 hypothetical protein OUZ56_006528 [Daphnia magna]